MIARIIQWLRQGGRRYPQNTSPFGGTLGNNVGGIIFIGPTAIGGRELVLLSSPVRTSLIADSPASEIAIHYSSAIIAIEGDSRV